MKTFTCHSLNDTKKAAEHFASFAKPGQCFALYGNLGFGKTTFTQYFIKYLNSEIDHIISPTFNIIQTYPTSISELWHIDCYRLESPEEFYNLGLEEAISDYITVIEWPEIIEDFLPYNTIKIRFNKNQDIRTIEQIF